MIEAPRIPGVLITQGNSFCDGERSPLQTRTHNVSGSGALGFAVTAQVCLPYLRHRDMVHQLGGAVLQETAYSSIAYFQAYQRRMVHRVAIRYMKINNSLLCKGKFNFMKLITTVPQYSGTSVTSEEHKIFLWDKPSTLELFCKNRIFLLQWIFLSYCPQMFQQFMHEL